MKHAGFATALAATLPDEARAGPPEPRNRAPDFVEIKPGEIVAVDLDGRGWEAALREDHGIVLGSADPLSAAISALCGRIDVVEREIGDWPAGVATAMLDLRERTEAVERGLAAIGDHSTPLLDPGPNAARSLLDLSERLQRLEKQIAFMSSAQAMQERQIALHTRATAADLAIKGAVPGDLLMQTAMADAWLAWLSAGVT